MIGEPIKEALVPQPKLKRLGAAVGLRLVPFHSVAFDHGEHGCPVKGIKGFPSDQRFGFGAASFPVRIGSPNGFKIEIDNKILVFLSFTRRNS